jgi:flavodoxin
MPMSQDPGALCLSLHSIRVKDNCRADCRSACNPADKLPPSLRVALVCASKHHGNTQRIAAAMAVAAGAVLLTPQQAEADGLREYDLVGFGSGVYFGRPDRRLRQLIAALPQLPPSAFVFTTSGLPWLWRLYHFGLRWRLRSRGCRVTGDFACAGWDTVGPLAWIGGLNRCRPNADDCLRAERFIAVQIDLAASRRSGGVSL